MDDLRALKVIGCGGMGTVILVEKEGYERPLALKAMNKSAISERVDGLERAELERNILSKLHHPFLPELLSSMETEKTVGFLMEYCPGGDLHSLRLKQTERAFSESIIRFYAAEIVLALEYLHKMGIVYRDLKPENVLIQSDGHVMLTDFDLSAFITPSAPYQEERQSLDDVKRKPSKSRVVRRMLRRSSSSSSSSSSQKAEKCSNTSPSSARVTPAKESNEKSNSFVGTEEYVSPEMVSGKDHDFSVDWWALGVLLYEMVYGKTPFKGSTRKDTFFNILVKEPSFMGPCDDLTDLIKSLLHKSPSKRLGGVGGAQAVKSHAFFHGLDWDALPHVARPPFVPTPSPKCKSWLQGSSIEEYVEEFQARLFARLKEAKEGDLEKESKVEQNHHWIETVCDSSPVAHGESYGVF